MATLSNEDIKRELGKNIFIHPFKMDEIKGGSINLTASKLGWSLKTKSSIYDHGKNCLVIPANDTALIETEETLYVTDKICGTYHSKVALVSQGIGHIGTTLDPEWIGPSLIALHNRSDDAIEIKIGKSFVSIMFHYLKTPSTARNTNYAGRPELLNNYNLTQDEKDWLDEDWRSHSDKLIEKMKNNADYKQLQSQIVSKWSWVSGGLAKNIYLFAICLISIFVFYKYKQEWGLEPKDFLVPIIAAYLAGTATQVLTKSSSS